MIRAAIIIISMLILSSIYGRIVIENIDMFNILTFHVPMVAMDSFAINLLLKDKVPVLTQALVVILSLSIINHSIGAYAWVSYNEQARLIYDHIRHALVFLEILAFIGGGLNFLSNSRRIAEQYSATPRTGIPGLFVTASIVEDKECD